MRNEPQAVLRPGYMMEMMESRTPRTAIFNPLLVCLERVQDAQEADVPFVFIRL
jgi:hypothetical protein